MANMIFNLDLNKNNAINPIIFGRLTDGNLRKITVNITNEGEPVDLTDWVIRFEGTTGGRAKVFDVLGVNILDAKNGKFEYTFSKTAFSASGAYTTAYFAIEKDNMRETTNDIKIIVENVADLDAQDAETVVTELNKTITLINQRYAELNNRVDIYEGDIVNVEEWLLGKKTEIENIIESANSTFNQKLSEIQAKLDETNQAIEKGSETIAYAKSADGTDGFTTVYPNLNLLKGTKTSKSITGNNAVNQGSLLYSFDNNSTLNNQGFSINDTIALEFDWSATNPASGRFILQWQGTPWGFDVPAINLSSTNGSGHVIHTYNIKAADVASTAVATGIGYRFDNIPANTVITFSNVIIRKAKGSQPWMPSSSEATTADYPSYIGYSNKVKTNKVASDYKWFPTITSHTSDKTNPHAVTAEQVNAYTKTVTFTKTEIQDLLSDAIAQSKLDANPIGTILTTISNTNPSTYIGGTWIRFANGRTLVGVDENDSVTLMKTANNTGGSTNPLTRHSHDISRVNGTTQSAIGASIGWSDLPNNGGVVKESGDNTNHNNWQPFVTVYFWRRTA